MVARSLRKGVIINGHVVSFWSDQKVLELDSGESCTTFNILKTTEWYILNHKFCGMLTITIKILL